MADPLDMQMLALKREPLDVRLDQLEPRVWARLDGAGAEPQAGRTVFAFRTAAVVGALVLGLATGGLTALTAEPRTDEISVFSVGPQLAPSTLLEGRG